MPDGLTGLGGAPSCFQLPHSWKPGVVLGLGGPGALAPFAKVPASGPAPQQPSPAPHTQSSQFFGSHHAPWKIGLSVQACWGWPPPPPHPPSPPGDHLPWAGHPFQPGFSGLAGTSRANQGLGPVPFDSPGAKTGGEAWGPRVQGAWQPFQGPQRGVVHPRVRVATPNSNFRVLLGLPGQGRG